MTAAKPSIEPAFVTKQWVMDRLGLSSSAYYRRLPAMRAEGLPEPDPLMNLYHRDDVEAWIQSRRTFKNQPTVEIRNTPDLKKVNFDAL